MDSQANGHRVVPEIWDILHPLEDALQSILLLHFTEGFHQTQWKESYLLYWSDRRDGNQNLVEQADTEFRSSCKICAPMKEVINTGCTSYSYDICTEQIRECQQLETAITRQAPESNGPIQDHGFRLHKTAFLDAVALRYSWIPPDLSSNCACSSKQHALSSPKGGFPSIRPRYPTTLNGSAGWVTVTWATRTTPRRMTGWGCTHLRLTIATE